MDDERVAVSIDIALCPVIPAFAGMTIEYE